MAAEHWDKIIRTTGPSAGGLLVAATGGHLGPYAKDFEEPYDKIASSICVVAMGFGFITTILFVIVKAVQEVLKA